MPNLHLAVLGPWQMHLGGRPVTHFPTTKVQALLAYLAVEAQSAHTRDALLGLFWPEYSASSARQNLRKTLQRLRQLLPDGYLVATGQTLQFDPASDYHLDVTVFTGLVAPCRHKSPVTPLACPACIDRLEQAVALYRGDFLDHFFVEESPAFEEWLLLKREWLRREALGALHQLAAYHQRREDYDRAYTYAWQQVELDPLREEAHRQVMSILALRGQRSEALAQYEACRQILAGELDVTPSEETTELYERIRSGQFEGAGRPAPVTSSPPGPSKPPLPLHNLPTPLNAFLGREQELVDARRLLGAHRLLTLTGVGGTGKTRLALEIAHSLAAEERDAAASSAGTLPFEDGICWVELAPLTDPALIPQAVAKSLGVREQGGQPIEHTLAEYLRRRRLLLLLDNCEHLIAPCAQSVHQWLEASPDLHILATSREPLHLRGEQRFPVAPLAADSACRLFVQCARQINPSFALAPESPAIAELCRRLDYLPLAIELLAARIDLFSPEDMLVRLQTSPLDLLSGGARDLPPRQQTVRSAIQHSYDLLTGGERALFRTLGVFVGGFDLLAVARFGFGEELVYSLLQKSLVRPDPSAQHKRRFFLLETLREYACEQLRAHGELTERQQQHAAYYLALAQTAEPMLMGPKQYKWAEQLEAEMGNLRAALGWLQAADVEKGLQLANALWFFWLMHSHLQEARQWLESLLTRSGGTLASRAKAAVYAITFARFQGDYMAVASFAPHAADLARAAGDKLMLGLAFIILGRVAVHVEKNDAQGQRWKEQALLLFQEAESPPGFYTAMACEALGHSAQDRGALAEAGEWLEESLRLRQQTGNEWMTQYSYYSLGSLEYDRGRLERAIACFEAGLQIGRKYGDKRNCAIAQSELAEMLLHQGQDDRAAVLLQEGLVLGRGLAERYIVRSCLIGLATVARHAAQYEQAQAFLNESLRYAEVTTRHLRPTRVQHELAYVAALQGDDAQALALYQSCIVKWQECNQPLWIASALQGCALLAVQSGQPERALRLGAAAAALRHAHGPAFGLDTDLYLSVAEQTHWEQTIDAARMQLNEACARCLWDEGRAMSLAEAVRYALAGEPRN